MICAGRSVSNAPVGAPAPPIRAISVLPDVTGIDRRFTYLIPEDYEGPAIEVGDLVRVNLAGRRVRAWVLAREGDLSAELPDGVLAKPILGFVSRALSQEIVDLAEACARYYVSRLRPFLGAGTPDRNVRPGDLSAAQAKRAAAIRARREVSAGERHPGYRAGDPVALLARRLFDEGGGVIELPPNAARLLLVESLLEAVMTREPSATLLVLVPEHRDVAILAKHLVELGRSCAALPEEHVLAASGVDVVIGTRTALFAPIEHLGGIVVLDAHAESYRDERAPNWSAPTVARLRAVAARVPLILVSPCVPLVFSRDSEPAKLETALARAYWPVIETLDRRGDDPRSGLYATELGEMIREALARDDRRVAVILNRTGRLRLLACHFCGEIARCEHCGGAMHQRERAGSGAANLLHCVSCNAERPELCAICGRARLRSLRVGATRAAEELGAIVGVETGLVTGATIDEVAAPLIVGTEAVLHRLRAASLVVFLDFDQHLLAARFGAAEESLALLCTAGRLVGGRATRRADHPWRRVVVQTRLPEHEVLLAARAGDPSQLRAGERALRRELSLPPFSALALASGGDATELARRLGALPSSPSEHRRLEVVPFGGVAAGRYLLRAPDHEVLASSLRLVHSRELNLRLEFDPRAL